MIRQQRVGLLGSTLLLSRAHTPNYNLQSLQCYPFPPHGGTIHGNLKLVKKKKKKKKPLSTVDGTNS